ncbi:C39 family peptidase [Aldersonia sp. NBC_00410]|uniref:C39 family peptidase n=1 Tax=Aldersonia sp. NBC_00410 TaxID=2975954 RepID=UPI002252D736|nr:C39 family peptidase [Aldersonia sp. NBC_00410]MCX5046660.1 C39 family peptidase [Aldersonia sp. NBC_00410]
MHSFDIDPFGPAGEDTAVDIDPHPIAASIDFTDNDFAGGGGIDPQLIAPAIDFSTSFDGAHIPDIPDLAPHSAATPPPPAPDPEPAPLPAPEPEPDPAPAPQDDPAASPPAPENTVHGDADTYADNWFYQVVNGYCGPSSAAQIVSEYTGLDIKDPEQLASRATELGLWCNGDPSQGMTLSNLEVLLDDQGVPCHTESSSLDDLEHLLDQGYGVIAMVDSGEIWDPASENGEDGQPDHVLVVTSIDTDRGVVVLSDTGKPDGNEETVPIDQFENAWADSGHRLLVADNPDPNLAAAPPVDQAVTAVDHYPWSIVDLAHRAGAS